MINIEDIDNKPANVEAERSYLSCIFQEPSLIYQSPIEAKHFYDSFHRKIYTKMLTLKSSDITIDAFTMGDDFSDDHIFDLASLVMSTHNFKDYIEIILEFYNRRVIQDKSNSLIYACKEEEDFDDIMERVSNIIKWVEGTEKVKTLIPGVFETIENLIENKDSVYIGPTWYNKLDQIIWWYRPWAFYILWARPGMGKSTMMMNLMLRAVKNKMQSAIFSLEMVDSEIHTRIMCALSWKEQREIEKRDRGVLEDVAEKIAWQGIDTQCNIYDDVKYMEDMERLIAKEASMGTKLIFIDYIQLIKTKENYWNTNAMLEHISSTLKWLAQKYRISVFWLAQLNRSLEAGKIPSMQHLRWSWWLEQDVDVCLMLHNVKNDMWDKCSDKEVRCEIVKNRQGIQSFVMFDYFRPIYLIEDWE